jgi:hypothetical protein
MKPEELEDLVARFLAGQSSEEEEKRLLDLLEGSAGVRKTVGLDLAVDRLLRESGKPALSAERILRALPPGSREEFASAVMGRLPERPRLRTYLVPGVVAAGLLAALVIYAALPTSTSVPSSVDVPDVDIARTRPSPRPNAVRLEAEEERSRAEVERKEAEGTVAALRQKELEATRERKRAEQDKEEESRKKAEEEIERLKTERQAEEARLVEALERERRAAAQTARTEQAPQDPKVLLRKTMAFAATIERVDGKVTLLSGDGKRAVLAPQGLLSGQGVETSGREGAALLAFADHTQLDLGADTEVREITERETPGPGGYGKRLVVVRGRVAATVTKQPPDQPLDFVTPHGEAKVVGTTLRLTVDASGTRLEVTEGKVLLSRPDGKSVVVTGGHYAQAAAGIELAPKVILDRLHYEATLVKRSDLLFFEDFEQDAWKRHWSSPSETSRVTEEHGFTLVGRRALEVRQKAGEALSDGWHRLTLPNGFPKVHLRAYFYFPKDFELGPQGSVSLFKVGALPTGPGHEEGMSLWADHRPNGRDFYSADLVLTRGWTLQFGYYHPDQAGPKGDWKECARTEAVSVKPGRWHSVEILCQANDPGQKNGILRAWINGTLCGEENGIRFRDVETLQIREIALTGGGSPSPKNQSYYVDDVVLAREYIGAALGDADGVEPRTKR